MYNKSHLPKIFKNVSKIKPLMCYVLLTTRNSVAKQLGFSGNWARLRKIRDQTRPPRVRGRTRQHEKAQWRELRSARVQGGSRSYQRWPHQQLQLTAYTELSYWIM